MRIIPAISMILVVAVIASPAMAEKPMSDPQTWDRLSRRKIDLPYFEPAPALTVAYGTVFPGGGWFYLSATKHRRKWDFLTGAIFAAVTIGTGFIVNNGIIKKNDGQAISGMACFLAVRWTDLSMSVQEALRRKHSEE